MRKVRRLPDAARRERDHFVDVGGGLGLGVRVAPSAPVLRFMHGHSGELVRILSHVILTAQPPAALLELILIGMQLVFFFFATFIMSVSALRQCVTGRIEAACPKMYVWLSSIS